MGHITSVSIVVNKTVQEKQYEPVRLEIGLTYALTEGESLETAAENLEFQAYQELHSAFERYYEANRRRRNDLEAKRDALLAINRQLDRL